MEEEIRYLMREYARKEYRNYYDIAGIQDEFNSWVAKKLWNEFLKETGRE